MSHHRPPLPTNCILIEHPFVNSILTHLREKKTPTQEFRAGLKMLGTVLFYEAARGLAGTELTLIETPLCIIDAPKLVDRFVLVSVLRAGDGLLHGALEIAPPETRVGHIGISRNHETLEPREYLPLQDMNMKEAHVIILDPMLATGGSACLAIKRVQEREPCCISLVCIVACPTGLNRVNKEYPDVTVWTAAVDPELNDKGYIVPGLGDAGDRLNGT